MSQLSTIIKQIREQRITSIYIRDIDFSVAEDGELKELACLIREMPSLSSITLQNVNLVSVSQENLKLIFESIQARKEVLDIWFPYNDLGLSPDKFLLIMERLIGINIGGLNLSGNSLNYLNEAALRKLLTFQPLISKEIDLSENQLGQLANKGLLMFGQYFISCQGIAALQLQDNSLGLNRFICEFFEQLQQLRLEELNFAGDALGNITDPDRKVDVRRFIELLTQHPTLKKLNLADNSLCDWGSENLSLFLGLMSQHNKIKWLDIRTNQFESILKDTDKDPFFNNFASFVAAASLFEVEVIYDYFNFDEEGNRAALMGKISQHKSLLMSQSIFGGIKDEIQQPPVDEVAREVVVVLRRIPTLQTLFKQRDKLRLFLQQVDDAVVSEITGKKESTASPVSTGETFVQIP